ncbi:MAG: F0F1 ATP synthase subunit A [Bacteriovoracaceae bacterium]
MKNTKLFSLAKLLLLIAFTPFNSAQAEGHGFTYFSGMAHALAVGEHVVTFVFVGILIILFGLIYRFKSSLVENAFIPDKGITFKNITEAFGEFIYNLCRSTLGEKEAPRYFGMVSIIFLYIFLSNFIGLIPGFLPPTDNINTTLALGLFVFVYYNYHGIRAQGLVGHLKHFCGPVWYLAFLMLPIELISHAVRPVSLGLRLRGNMFGDHLVLSIFSGLVPYVVPIIFMVLGLFVCFIQSFVFSLLSMVYISLATATHDHEEHGH